MFSTMRKLLLCLGILSCDSSIGRTEAQQQQYFTSSVNERAVACESDPNLIGYKTITDVMVDQENEKLRVLGGEPPRSPYIFPFCSRFKFLIDREVLEVLLDDLIFFVCGYNGTNEELCVFEGGDVQVKIPQESSVVFKGITFSNFRQNSTVVSAAGADVVFDDVVWSDFEYPATLVHQEAETQVGIRQGAIQGGTGSHLLVNSGGSLVIDGLAVSDGAVAESLIRSIDGGTASLENISITNSTIQSVLSVSSESTLSLSSATIGPDGAVEDIGIPSSPPTSEAFASLVAYLEGLPVTEAGVFEDPTSPQYRAALWLTEHDTYTAISRTLQGPGIIQRYAVVTFYYATNGDDWKLCGLNSPSCGDSFWLQGIDECDWFSIRCRGGIVEQFNFPATGNSMHGNFPAEMSLLTGLKRLLAPENSLSGNLDRALGGLSTLETLVLPDNRLEGAVPTGIIERNPNLGFLDLGGNQFSGTLPTDMGVATMLSVLKLTDNQLTGTIPTEIGSLSRLMNFEVQENELVGNIPDELFSLNKLVTVSVRENAGITGTISSLISQLTALSVLQLGETGIGGPLPEELFLLMDLNEMNLEGANFAGTLPESFRLLNASLMDLFLNDNQFTGPVPEAFDYLTALETLQIQGNQLTGSISPAVCAERGLRFQQLATLIVDCVVECDCCDTCME